MTVITYSRKEPEEVQDWYNRVERPEVFRHADKSFRAGDTSLLYV